MRTRALCAALLATALLAPGAPARSLREGDLVFQDSRSVQTPAIQLATKSRYSHCGVVLMRGGALHVFEAASRVRATPLRAWIARGADHHCLAMRLRDRAALDVAKLRAEAAKLEGKPYDPEFLWDDERIYCSELAWKLYERCGVRLTPLKRLRDFDLTHPKFRAMLAERYGGKPPLDEPVVAPADLVGSPLLERIER